MKIEMGAKNRVKSNALFHKLEEIIGTRTPRKNNTVPFDMGGKERAVKFYGHHIVGSNITQEEVAVK